jgi:hypothetical protein
MFRKIGSIAALGRFPRPIIMMSSLSAASMLQLRGVQSLKILGQVKNRMIT